MKNRYSFCVVLVLALFLSVAPAWAGLHRETVVYYDGGVTLEGYLVHDDSIEEQRPAVIVVHEWNGISSYILGRADQLAALGYIVFAADIYGKGVRPTYDLIESARQAKIYQSNRSLMRSRINAALNWLRTYSLTDPTRIAAIGYCFGGGVALELARSGANLSGIVSFHGLLDTPAPQDDKKIIPKVLVQTGADDPNVPPAQVAAFEKEMRAAGADWYLISYGNAVHRFTNPEAGSDNAKGAAYNEKADKRSWQAMQDFFAEIFK
jgi:dienelactone hydrolase